MTIIIGAHVNVYTFYRKNAWRTLYAFMLSCSILYPKMNPDIDTLYIPWFLWMPFLVSLGGIILSFICSLVIFTLLCCPEALIRIVLFY